MLSDEKPSAIFRLRGTFSSSSPSAAQNRFSSFSASNDSGQADVTAILGLSIEPLEQIHSQIQLLPTTLAKPDAPDLTKDPTALAERIVKHLFNYISSFTGGEGVSPTMAVPMTVIAKWYENFLGKIRAGGVGFLERGD